MTSELSPSSANGLTTEAVNSASAQIVTLSAHSIVRLMNAEDATVASAVAAETDSIARAIEVITNRLKHHGRLIYIGAGTSGRLGVLDSSECPPTFSTPPEMVLGLIAGGESALRTSAESIEDLPEYGAEDLRKTGLSSSDVVVGIATSGRTPYVIGALNFARTLGAFTIGLACNRGSALSQTADLMITPITGPEIIGGSTRLKAGTATKMILNMLSTGTMVQLGKTWGNLMVDLRATNTKLTARSRRLMMSLTGLTESRAEAALNQCDGELKTAAVMVLRDVSVEAARKLLKDCDHQLRRALKQEEDGDFS